MKKGFHPDDSATFCYWIYTSATVSTKIDIDVVVAEKGENF